jgi:hypothetical protein
MFRRTCELARWLNGFWHRTAAEAAESARRTTAAAAGRLRCCVDCGQTGQDQQWLQLM